MSSLCRMCLSGNVKMYCIENTKLKESYENVTNTKLNTGDIKPVIICYICHFQLQRCTKFFAMSQRAEKTITDIVNKGLKVTQELLIMLNLGMLENFNYSTIDIVSIDSYLNSSVNVKEELIKDEIEIPVKHSNMNVKKELASSVCRVCLSGCVGAYCIVSVGLKDVFEKVTNAKLNTEDGRPVTICYICLSQLKRCLRLSEMCEKADKLLANENNHAEVTQIPTLLLNLETVYNIAVIETTRAEPSLNSEDAKSSIIKFEFIEDSDQTIDDMKVFIKEEPNYVCQDDEDYQSEHGLINIFQKDTAVKIPYTCDLCTDTFQTISGLTKHKKIHLPRFTCDYCTKTFGYKQRLLSHMKKHGINPYICTQCNKTYSGKASLERHMITHGLELPYVCDICFKTFADPYCLKKHMIRHAGVKPYSCNICSKGYFEKHNLEIHMRSHSGIRPYECETCGKKFVDNSCKLRHMKIHTGVKPYACNQCSFRFTIKSRLIIHLRSHTGIKPFSCSQCPSKFGSKAILTKHKKLHEEKEYPCNKCTWSFSTMRCLQAHLRKIHKEKREYVCSECNKVYYAPGSLKIHMRSHTGEKPYACKECDMRFTSPTGCTRHEMAHGGNKYECKVCGNKYSRPGGLQQHTKQKHAKYK